MEDLNLGYIVVTVNVIGGMIDSCKEGVTGSTQIAVNKDAVGPTVSTRTGSIRPWNTMGAIVRIGMYAAPPRGT